MPEPGPDRALDEAVQGGDLDELLRLVERLASGGDWDRLDDLRQRCERAHETGRQLWPAAAHAAYRIALEAPAALAARVLVEGAGRFAIGPLPEVAAQDHQWSDLSAHVVPGAPAVVTAHERAVRGEDCRGAVPEGPAVLDLPLVLMPWEPRYALAEYRADGADFPAPDLPALEPIELPASSDADAPDDASRALLDLVRVWTAGSEGHADVVTVSGGWRDAVAAFGTRSARAAEVHGAAALALMAWAGASGGAHGRRPGAAFGRFAAWWTVASAAGLLDPWPPDPAVLGEAVTALRWVAWQPDEPATGWRLHLAVEHPARGQAWAIAAADPA